MEKFLNNKVVIFTCLGGADGAGFPYRGILTSYDDEYVCLDNNVYIVRKFIMSITLK